MPIMPPAPAAGTPRTTLLGELGAHHRTIKTSNAEAQKFFDEGLTLLFGFNHEESFKSFERAAALDPASPMPHWGMSLALGTNINDVALPDRLKQGYQHLAEAEKRKANGSEVEQGMVTALGKRYVADASGDQMVREQAYSAAMGELSKKFPDDLDVATLYAESIMNLHPWKLYKPDGTPEPWTARSRRDAGERDQAESAASGRESLLHPRRRSIEDTRSRDGVGRAARDARARRRPPGPHAGARLHSHRPVRQVGQGERRCRRGGREVLQGRPARRVSTRWPTTATTCSSSRLPRCSPVTSRRRARRPKRTVALVDPMADQMAMIEPFAMQELIVLTRFGRWNEILAATSKPPAATRTIQTALFHFVRGAALAGNRKDGRSREPS